MLLWQFTNYCERVFIAESSHPRSHVYFEIWTHSKVLKIQPLRYSELDCLGMLSEVDADIFRVRKSDKIDQSFLGLPLCETLFFVISLFYIPAQSFSSLYAQS